MNPSNPVFTIVDPQSSKSHSTKEIEDEKASPSDPSCATDMNTEASINESNRSLTDPLKWFGILTPPTLRSSQESFKGAVREIVPELANTVVEMKVVEIEVRRARKKLGKAR